MLQFVRDNASGWFVKLILWAIVFAFVGTIFLVWGYGDEYGERPAATIGSSVVTNSQVDRRFDQLLQQMNQAGTSVPDDYLIRQQMRKDVLRDIIIEELQYIAAKDAGFNVSDEELKDRLLSNPNFQVTGLFDKDLYFGILRNNNLSPKEYENILRRDLMVGKIVRLITDAVRATESELKEEFNRVNEEVSLQYMTISPALYEFNVKATSEVVTEFFEKDTERFNLPETRRIEILSLDPKIFAGTVSVTEQEMKSYYEKNQASFTSKEVVHARHILFKVEPNASFENIEEIRLKAEGVMKEIKEGADFAELAKKYSEGPTAQGGGDLGFFGRGKMVREFEQEAFAMQPGDLSGPILTRFGYHLIKMEEKFPAKLADFEQVKPGIKGKLVESRSIKIAKKKLLGVISVKPGEKKEWKDLAKAEKAVYKTEVVTAGREVGSISGSLAISDRAFTLNIGDKAGPFELPAGIYAARLLEIIPPHTPKLSEVRIQVEKVYKREKSEKMAADAADEFMKGLREGAKLADVAKETGLNIKNPGWVKRDGSIVGEISSAAIIQRAFTMNKDQYQLIDEGGRTYLIKLLDKKAPDEWKFAESRADMMRRVAERKRNRVLELWRVGLRKTASDSGTLDIDIEYL